MRGYSEKFLGDKYRVGFPDDSNYAKDIAINQQTKGYILDYIYYSVIQSKSRRVPIISASNIYRIKFETAARSGSFKKDPRIKNNEQLNSNDYSLFNKIKRAAIEKGHMTKREDVQWDIKGISKKAEVAAVSTFFYPNAVPQHDSLNNGLWKHLENSIIIKGRVPQPAKVSVFTGPVLDDEDPYFNGTLADHSKFKMPVLFWKVIYYLKEDGDLYYAGFLMGQINPLRRDNLIIDVRKRSFGDDERKSSLKPFLKFKEDTNYQVPVSLIEELTRLKFDKAIDRHASIKPSKLTIENVQIRSFGTTDFKSNPPTLVGGLLV